MCAKGWVHRLLRDPGSTATGCVSAWLGIYPFFILCVPRRYEECVSAIRTVNYISGSSQGGGMSSPDGVNPIRNRSFCSAEEMTCLPLTNKKEILVTLQGVHLMGWRSCYERYQSHRYVARSSYWTAYLRRTRAELLHRFWVWNWIFALTRLRPYSSASVIWRKSESGALTNSISSSDFCSVLKGIPKMGSRLTPSYQAISLSLSTSTRLDSSGPSLIASY